MSTAFREVEGRLVLTADAARLKRDLAGAGNAIGDFRRRFEGVVGGALGGVAVYQALHQALGMLEADYERIATAAYKFSGLAVSAKARADVAEMKRDQAQGVAAGPSVAQYEQARERLAQYEAERTGTARTIAEAGSAWATMKAMGATWAREMYANADGSEVSGLGLAYKGAKTYLDIGRRMDGGDRSPASDPGMWDLVKQYIRDRRSMARQESREGGG